MMFALGIIDKLTPGELNGGESIAGTGTIDATGAVGPIGGIRQKMYGAKDAGATVFLAPASNCDEVTGHIPSGLTVYSVKTLDDSLAVLKALSDGSSTSSLPTCPVG
jgi:PDZ domain-containing protein